MEIQQIPIFETRSPIDGNNESKLVFQQLTSEAIDNVLSSLGVECKQAIYDYVRKRYGLEKTDFAGHIIEFSEALGHMFGSASALLEIQIMKKLHQKVPQFRYWPREAQTFPGYINALSQFIYGKHEVQE